ARSGAPRSGSALTSAPATGKPAPSTTNPVNRAPAAAVPGSAGPSGARSAALPCGLVLDGAGRALCGRRTVTNTTAASITTQPISAAMPTPRERAGDLVGSAVL